MDRACRRANPPLINISSRVIPLGTGIPSVPYMQQSPYLPQLPCGPHAGHGMVGNIKDHHEGVAPTHWLGGMPK